MSLHLNQQCQRAQKTDALPNPFLVGRSGAWSLVTATTNQPVHRCGGAHLGEAIWTVNALTHFFLRIGFFRGELARATLSGAARMILLRLERWEAGPEGSHCPPLPADRPG